MVVVDVNAAAMGRTVARLESRGGGVMGLAADVRLARDCDRVVDSVAGAWGRIDVLVNNAGIGDLSMGTIRTTDERWRDVLEVDLGGPFYMCRAAIRHMTVSGGVIVNVSSVGGVYGGAGASYSAAKAGVIGLTKNIAMQYAGRGIRCNAVCPGTTVTPMVDPEKRDEFDADMMAASIRHFDESIGVLQPEEQAAVILFLSSDDSKGVTGQYLVADGGRFL